MWSVPVRYVEPVYRPPSEADSLILPVTDGCSWNQCTFCEMYTAPQKKFRARSELEINETIARCGEHYGSTARRVFLADGDALVLPTRRLLAILALIKNHLPLVRRVSSYCLPRNVHKKSLAELQELAAAGLSLVYVGAESGDDAVLAAVNKGETYASTAEALLKFGDAGIKRSVMLLNGLGGKQLSAQHALNSAQLINETQPEFLATLVVSFPKGDSRFREHFSEWSPLSQHELFCELQQLIDNLHLQRTVFRSDHASNWLILKGTLDQDKEKLLAQIRLAIEHPDAAPLRQGWQRGL